MEEEEYKNKAVASWTTSEVCEWLKSIGMERYLEVFISLNINGSMLLDIQESDLETDFSITIRVHRANLIKRINELKNTCTSPASK